MRTSRPMREQVGWGWGYLLEDLTKQSVIVLLPNQHNGANAVIYRYTGFLAYSNLA